MREGGANNLRRLMVGPVEAGHRVDRAVADWLGVSRNAALRLLDAGALRLNGGVIARQQKGVELQQGDTLDLEAGFGHDEAPRPDPALRIDVLAKGAGWLVINKPAGVPVRPHALDERGTVINAVAATHPKVVGVGEGGLRSGVVHRLDNDTSGTLLVATRQADWLRLRNAFAEHRVAKCYHALVHGDPSDLGESVQHLRVARHSPAHVEVVDATDTVGDARPCSLAWRVLERLRCGVCLVEVDLHTGFLHQVRVMMHHLGHPVLGDTHYGSDKPRHGAPRQMLHAYSLRYEEIAAEAPLPDDMAVVMQRLEAK